MFHFYRLLALLLLIILPVSSLAQSDSRPDSAKVENTLTINTEDRDSPQHRIKAGVQTGFPYILGYRLEYVLKRSQDQMPAYLLTWDALLTLGFATTLAIEGRLWRSPFYASCGYNYTKIIIPGSSTSPVFTGAIADFHSGLFAIGLRGSLSRNNFFNVSLGCLIAPKLKSDLPLFPVLSFRIISK